MFADDVNQVVVPILVLGAVRREPEARPIHGFIPCFRPAAFARGIVVESNHEACRRSYAWNISSCGTVDPAQLTTASASHRPAKRL
jgi:hypothetical protein